MTISDVSVSSGTMKNDEAEQLKENILFFCNTPKGSLPQMRNYGLDFSILDQPFHILRTRATVDIVKGIRKFYNVNISTINVTADSSGGAIIQITI